MRDATGRLMALEQLGYISIHASHAGRDPYASWVYNGEVVISIHASHAGRDHGYQKKLSRIHDISIHASHAGRDSDMNKFKSLFKTFLVLSQHNFTLLVTKSDFTTNKTMFILYKLGVIIKTASSSH